MLLRYWFTVAFDAFLFSPNNARSAVSSHAICNNGLQYSSYIFSLTSSTVETEAGTKEQSFLFWSHPLVHPMYNQSLMADVKERMFAIQIYNNCQTLWHDHTMSNIFSTKVRTDAVGTRRVGEWLMTFIVKKYQHSMPIFEVGKDVWKSHTKKWPKIHSMKFVYHEWLVCKCSIAWIHSFLS